MRGCCSLSAIAASAQHRFIIAGVNGSSLKSKRFLGVFGVSGIGGIVRLRYCEARFSGRWLSSGCIR